MVCRIFPAKVKQSIPVYTNFISCTCGFHMTARSKVWGSCVKYYCIWQCETSVKHSHVNVRGCRDEKYGNKMQHMQAKAGEIGSSIKATIITCKLLPLHGILIVACPSLFSAHLVTVVPTSQMFLLLCMYTCLCVYVYVCMYVMYVRMYVCMYVCICMYVPHIAYSKQGFRKFLWTQLLR